MENQTNYHFNSVNIIGYLYDKRRPLIIITLVAAIISIIASFVITPKFKSRVVLFPTTSGAVGKSLMSRNVSSDNDVLRFGEEEDTERLLQVLNSAEIKEKIINKFDLMAHYEIDTASKYPHTNLERKFENNFSFARTQYLAIEIEVLDKKPKMAADMANYAAALIDTLMNDMYKDRAQRALELVEEEYVSLNNQIKEMEDSLNSIREKGVNDYESQAEVLHGAYANAVLEGNNKAINLFQQKLNLLGKYGGPYVSFRDFLEFEMEELSALKSKYAQAKVDARQSLPYKFVVEEARVAEKKAYPVRSLIVIVSTLSAFFLALLVIIILDSLKSYLGKS